MSEEEGSFAAYCEATFKLLEAARKKGMSQQELQKLALKKGIPPESDIFYGWG
jgi:hypothetical protein